MQRRHFLQSSALAAFAPEKPAAEWRYYGGDQHATRYSPLAQINRSNIRKLDVAWVHHSAASNSRYRGSVECTPLVVDGVMYIVGAALRVQALDAATGRLLWTWEPPGVSGGGRRASGVSRGMVYHQGLLYAPIQSRIWCLDAKTGKVVDSFGEGGAIDVEKDVDRDMTGLSLQSTTPGAVYKDLLIITTRTEEGPKPAAPGHIRAYDLRTGKRRWIFHTIPHPGEFGYETWSPDAWKKTGGANCWGGLTVDERRGMVFVSTGSPTWDFYGGDRVGMNLFGNSILALNAETGKRIWHFQTVHHDLWDYDIPCQPTLVTMTHKGRKVDVVAQVSKTGWVYLFERATGKPIYPIEERPVPPSEIPGEKAWPTQPFPTAPPPFSRQGIRKEDLRPEVREQLKDYQLGPIFTPPGRRESVAMPGYHGGGLWGGASFDPESEWLYVNHNEIPWSTAIVDAPKDAGYPYQFTGYNRNHDDNSHPVITPPWGMISAIDLKNATIKWQVPHGEFKKLSAKGMKRTGTYIRGGNIATKGGVLFAGGTLDSTFRAYDAKNGEVLWEKYMGGGTFATPSTYEAGGRQFVVVPVSDDLNPEEPAEPGPYKIGDFVAFAVNG
ncbi:MAG: pyrroloquinoline quinone-dependent dehydrogenase [Bryobacterales bacterium]|nr:pyrroloquinoline quinone-dependent dehydrogenase [Bryobacterales bacterium]